MFLAKRKIKFANLYLDTRWSFSSWDGQMVRRLAIYFRWRYSLCYYPISIRLVFKMKLAFWLVDIKSIKTSFWNLSGVYGFLNVKDTKYTGNYGLMDQQMAIKFIYDNADKIGGDRNRITIGGESAGSISSSFQMLTPETSQYVNQGWFYQNVT